MDILCTRCGEPWDVFSLVDDMTPEEAENLKAGKGCPCCTGKEPCQEGKTDCQECGYYVRFKGCILGQFKPINDEARFIQRGLAEVLGDDIDGLAGAMDDFGLI